MSIKVDFSLQKLGEINFYVYFCKQKKDMNRNLLIELLEDGDKISLYSPHFEGEEYSEFEKFLLTYKDSYPDDVRQLVYRLDIIKRDGAADRHFRYNYLQDIHGPGRGYSHCTQKLKTSRKVHPWAFFYDFLSTFAPRYAKRKENIVPSRILCQWQLCASFGFERGF